MYYRRTAPLNRVSQGDIYQELSIPFDIKPVSPETEEGLEVTEHNYNYAVVLTQECDLDLDFKYRTEPKETQDKYIPYILFAPAYLSEKLRKGIHLQEIDLIMQSINSKNWEILRNNDNPRYHYMPKSPDLGIPDLVIDFKHYFTISRNIFCTQTMVSNYIASIQPLFREALSDRFGHYLSRIGLPDPAVPAPQQA